jgi:hypothetical protein
MSNQKARTFSYEMVADAFYKWITAQGPGLPRHEQEACKEQLIGQIKHFYPDEKQLSEDVQLVINRLLEARASQAGNAQRVQCVGSNAKLERLAWPYGQSMH